LKILFTSIYETSQLNVEVNCTEPSSSASIPCLSTSYIATKMFVHFAGHLSIK
jgi:hypothetical protein